MTTYIILNTIIIFAILIFSTYIFLWIKKTEKKNAEANDTKKEDGKLEYLGWKVYLLLIIVAVLIVVAFIAPFIFTRKSVTEDFNFTQSGQIGDTIGGLMNPFIALAGVIVTGLAFYIQYRANLQQRQLFVLEQAENKKQLQLQIDNQNEQNNIQQFDSQFYEMLKLHRENITEMKINGYDYEESIPLKRFEKNTDGRKTFVTMKKELEAILSIYTADRKLNKQSFNKCYQLFFSGLDEFEKTNPDEKDFCNILRKARRNHERPNENNIKTNKERKEFLPYAHLYFNYKPFAGHASRLGHYFRHLYLTVKSIANSPIIKDYENKMKYLRLLRAQLSNHEQILLFYNWLSDYGNDWENEKNEFFSEYCMIHNLWYDMLFADSFIIEEVNQLRIKEVKLRKGKMFEID